MVQAEFTSTDIVLGQRVSSSPPSTLGKYQIIREIARSNDIVYEGYDPLMTRRVAVKELNMPQGATPQQAEDRISRFKREAQAAGRLNHPNIMTVYDVEEDAGRLFMAMEYLDGQTLRAEIDQHGKLAPERAVEVARAVLAGLEHAHKQGVVHRDIKPDNVQILSNGAIKITDFGIARLTFQPNLTMDGQVFGTPSYMSPEQVVGKEIDPRSDIFSVGVMLYEMLAGVKPFAGDSVVTITYAIMNREPDPLPNTVPWPLGEAVRRSLEKTPHLRFDDAASMSKALEDALRPVPQPVYDPPVYSTPAPASMTPMGQQPYNPYGAQPPVINAPYNPYGAPAPVPSAPPPTYPYNPYTQQPYGGPGPTMAPPGTPVPIYYPPPPRKPLLKPETSAFIKKLTVAFIVFGTFFALILVGFWAVLNSIGRMNANRDGQSLVDSINTISQELPLEEQIRLLKDRRSKLAANADTTQFDKALADRYQRLARREMGTGNYTNVERYLQEAYGWDKHNPDLLVAYGDFFKSQAQLKSGPMEQADLFRQASEKYLEAQSQDTDRTRKAQEGQAGAEMAYFYAYSAQQSGDTDAMRDARRVLATAQPYATGDLSSRIQQLLSELR
ncbi:serine/threonine protein kinase [bacterium]|nr:MAG: serine/threonine protein kinase [bacterium]